jgi:superfamily II DNA or RNA helicase
VRLQFDRGTILLHDVPSGLDALTLPGVLWDPRVGTPRTPAMLHAALRARLVERGVAFHDDVVAPGVGPPAGWQALDLRAYQSAALCAWTLGGRRGIVVLPTGSGKTRVAHAAIAATQVPALCLVPTRILLDQWVHTIGEHYDGPVGCLGDGRHELEAVTVATFESAYRHMARIGNRFGLLIVDEAHHFGCGLRDEALEMCVAAARLGLTATPVREEPAATRLEQLLGPVVFELGVGDLTGTHLAQLDVVSLHLELAPDERAAYERDIGLFQGVRGHFARLAPRASWDDFARWAARTDAGRRALAAHRRARRLVAFTRAKRRAVGELLARLRTARVLVFTADNEAAYAIAREHLVMPLTCDIGRRERDAALTAFREGRLRALVSARVLNEGIDVPDAEVAIVIGGGLGEREHVQRVGRLLRPRPDKRAVVYELLTRRTLEESLARRRRAGLAARAPHRP